MRGNAERSSDASPLNESAGDSLIGHHRMTRKRSRAIHVSKNFLFLQKKQMTIPKKGMVRHLICAPAQ